MDPELRVYLDDLKATLEERFAQQDARLEERFAQQDSRLEERFARQDERFERIETTVRHTQVLVEALDSEIRLVAEGVAGVSERLEAFQKETAQKFEEVQASFAPYFRNVNGRLERLEDDVPALERRVTVLEARASRRVGKKPPTQ